MKKTFANIRTLAALLIASAALAACSNDDGAIIGEQPAQEQGPQVYTLTLQAGKADNAQTRALDLDGTKLVAKWAAGEQVTVTKGTASLGTLSVKEGSVSADGKTCTFTGTLTGNIATDEVLTLTYHPMASLSAFGSQNGQLVSAAACDMATASVTVTAVDNGKNTITAGTAVFETKTAVLKINLQDTGGSALNASSLTISAGDAEIFTLSPLAVVGTLYFALPSAATVAAAKGITTDALAALPITFSAKVGDDTYTATKTGYPFAAGKYYETTLKMAKAAPTTVTLTPGQIGYLYGGDKKTIGDITIELTGDASFHGAGHMFVKGEFNPEIHSDPEEVTGAGTFTFTSSVGNIKRIDINHEYGSWSGAGAGWPASYDVSENGTFTWSGTPAASVTLNGSQDFDHECSIYYFSSIVFTLEK